MSNFYLILYILLWFVTFIFYQRRKKYFDAGSVLILTYLLYASLSLLTFNDKYAPVEYCELQPFPFLYLYLMLMLASWPVYRYDQLKTRGIQSPSRLLLNTLIIIFIVSTLLNLVQQFPNLLSGFTRILIDPTGGQDVYNDIMQDSYDSGDGAISNLPSIISNALSNLGILLFFYYLTLSNRSKLLSAGLLLSCLAIPFASIATSQRGPVLEWLITLIITFFALRKFIPDTIKRKIRVCGILIIILISTPIIIITLSRFGDNDNKKNNGGALSSVLWYTGQINLNFNCYGLDNGGIRYGDRTFPMFKKMAGFDNVPNNFWERRRKYPDLKVNDGVFIGFVGDFTLDFGPYLVPIIFLLFTFYFLHKTRRRKGKLLFHQVIYLHLVMCICMQGSVKLFSFADMGGLKLITYVLAYYYFRLDYESTNRKLLKKSMNNTKSELTI
ncbi:MAG: O-antigen polymerase [Bacteroidales bacterium]